MAGRTKPEAKLQPPAAGEAKLDLILPATLSFPVIAVGASAGGLQACRALLDCWPTETEAAFLIIQHLDPHHSSLLVELLASHTAMSVAQAQNGQQIEASHVYIIPPGKFLAVDGRLLTLSNPDTGLGVRLPFDFLLKSLAKEYADRAVCIVLSGTGADGSIGLASIKKSGGLIVAQDPVEAEFSDMPHNAIKTGVVDQVLKIKDMPEAIALAFNHGGPRIVVSDFKPAIHLKNGVAEIVDWLHAKTAHDFRLYKSGTLSRRIERRMGLSGASGKSIETYLTKLKADPAETDALAQDLLINVTNFFRDTAVFEYLAKSTIADLVAKHGDDAPLRIWVAGCSTGEEAYSLAILFLEAIEIANRRLKIQLFASDTDREAVEVARQGRYSTSIKDHVSPERLKRFFTPEDDGFRVSADLRATIVFTIQDILVDPPFARIDLISCRNLLIYLGPEAQKRLISLFHFGLLPQGLLLLGNAETPGANNALFSPVNKSVRLFRKVGTQKPSTEGFMTTGKSVEPIKNSQKTVATSPVSSYAELCNRFVLGTLAPAVVLINEKHEWLYALGPTERYLRSASGYPTSDLMALATPALRVKLGIVVQQAKDTNKTAEISGGKSDASQRFRIRAIPVVHGLEKLTFICFLDDVEGMKAEGVILSGDEGNFRVRTLEKELAETRTELDSAVRNLEVAGEEQAAFNAETLSVNEEYQSVNEELLTSKEELQSLNEELSALNTQLQETLDLHRTTSNDLQNVLYSTNVATIFLDLNLNIRFFTPATKSLFNIIPGDINRPLSDLNSLAFDAALLDDARKVLANGQAKEREIEARSGAWYLRRILPYLTHDSAIEGVVITFSDITDRRHISDDLGVAKRVAETATMAKSRFLAAASHDLRQPLQTLSLLQGLLATMVEGEKAKQLVERFESTLSAMSGMLSTLLDINQIETGFVKPEPIHFRINEMFTRLKDEFSYHASAKALTLRVVPCNVEIHGDPRLLEQMLRNLLSNAFKYTKSGKVLLGCRRRHGVLSIEIWDTGIGIPDSELQRIFEEYHQLDNPARERGRGLGLGLAIVQSLVNLLGYKIRVRSKLGKGSVFAIEIDLPTGQITPPVSKFPAKVVSSPAAIEHQTRRILIVEDDPDVRDLLELILATEGYQTKSVGDGATALELVRDGSYVPDMMMADYNLPNNLNGVQLTAKIRKSLNRQTPVIILTGDISTLAAEGIGLEDCVHLNKPVKLQQLLQVVHSLLETATVAGIKMAAPLAMPIMPHLSGARTVYVVDDDAMVRAALRDILEFHGFEVLDFADCETFLFGYQTSENTCLLIDAYLPGMDGFQLIESLKDKGQSLPSIMITGHSDVQMAVRAMKAGAWDFFEKPISASELLSSVERIFERSKDENKTRAWQNSAKSLLESLTERQRQIMDLVLAGHPSKNIAADLGISQRTVESHRASIMKKTGCKSLPALARLALSAAG